MTTTQIVMINNSLIQDYMYIHPDDHYLTFLLWNLNMLTKRNFCFEVYLLPPPTLQVSIPQLLVISAVTYKSALVTSKIIQQSEKLLQC